MAQEGKVAGTTIQHTAARSLLAAAEQQLASSNPTACLGLLAALPLQERQQLHVRQLQLLCHVQLTGGAASRAWWKVFGLNPAAASAADVRRQYRRLAALIHPDKCALAGAAGAFKQLAAAAEHLLQSVGDEAEPRLKRRRSQSATAAAADAGAEGGWEEGGGVFEGGDEAWFRDGGGFPWWEEWEEAAGPTGTAARQAPAAAAAASAAADREETLQQRHHALAAGEEQQAHDAPGDGGGQTSGGAAADEERRLQCMPLPELRAEVQQRQARLLEPQLDASGQPIPLAQLQAALRRARSVLADRTAAEAAHRAAALGGGFLR